MAKIQFSPPITDVKEMTRNGKLSWEKSALKSYAKASSVRFKPNRMDPTFEPDFIMPNFDIYGRAIVNKPGVYPYGSATGTTPVSSTSLKAGTYKRAGIKGKGVSKRKQAALWGRYVPCEGIANGTSTSIDTGVYAQDNIEICVRVMVKTDSFYILQSRETGTATIYGLSGSQTGNTITSFGLTSGITRTDGHIYTIKLTMVNGAITLYVKDETTGTEDTKTGTVQTSTYTFPSPTTLKLFGDASKVTSGTTVYRAYIKVNGQMAWNMYPCIDVVNSNSPVAYDDVTHAASTVRSGSITAGSLIQPVSFAEGDGTAWADTGSYGSEKTKITIDFQKTDNTQTNMQIVGSNTNTSNAITCNMGSGGSNVSRFGSENKTVALFQDLNRHTLTVANDGYIADGTNVWTPNAAAFTTPDTLLLLSTQNSTSRFVGKVYSANLTEDGTLVRDYLPVRVGTTVELLDLVNWKFATRTGTFVAGPDVPLTELCPDIIETNAGDALYGQWGKNLIFKTLNANILSSGVLTADSSYQMHVAKLTANTTYAITTGTDPSRIYGLFLTEPSVGDTAYDAQRHIQSGITVTPTVDCYIAFRSSTGYNAQIEVGSTTTSYEPPHFGLHPSGEQTVTVGNQTRTITTFLPSANSFIDAQKPSNNVECDWTIMAFTGANSENWIKNSDGIFYIVDEMFQKKDNQNGVLCDRYEYVKSSLTSLVTNGKFSIFCTFAEGTVAKIVVHDDRFTTVAEWKAHLASKPAIVAFPRETPEVTTVTLSELTQPLGTVTILNEFADGTKGAVDFYGVNIQVNTPVPKPDEPYPLLSNVGEVSYGQWGKNIYNKNNRTRIYGYFASSGTTWSYNASAYCNKLPCKPNTTYTARYNGNSTQAVLGFGSCSTDDEPSASTGNVTVTQAIRQNSPTLSTPVTITTGPNDKWLIVAYNVAEPQHTDMADNLQIEEGSTATPYEPYKVGWHGDGQQTVKMESVNLWNLGDFLNGTGTQKTLEGLDESKTYTILVKASSDYATDSTAWSVSPRNADGSSRGNLFYMNNYVAGQTVSVEFTGAAMLRIQGTSFSGSFYICVIEGSATEFSPYATPQTRTTTEILPSATSKLNMQGGNDNKDCDWVFKVLDGTETGWGLASNGTVAYLPITDGMTGDPTTFRVSIPCSHFVGTDALNADMPNYSIKLSVSSAEPNISKVWIKFDGNVIDLTAFKALLAEVKPIVAYPRATSVKSTVTTTPFTVPDKTEYVASSDSESGVCDVAITCLSKSM